MTWSRAKSTGSGKLQYRLRIEGLHTEFVTDTGLERSFDGSLSVAARKVGLQRDGIEFGDEANIPLGKIKQSTVSLTIKDVNGAATDAFATRPSVITWARAETLIGGTQVFVKSEVGWSVNDILHLNTEAMRVSSVATGVLGVDRAIFGTVEQRHWAPGSDVLISTMATPMICNRPFSISGRRAQISVYGENDGPTGNGTTIYRGIVSGEPSLGSDGVSWRVSLDPVSGLLSQNINGSINVSSSHRGIYYPWNAPLYIRVGHGYSEAWASLDGLEEAGDVLLTGFYENQGEFVTALNTALNTISSGWDTVFGAMYVSESEYKIIADTTVVGKMPVLVGFDSYIDQLSGITAQTGVVGYWRNEDSGELEGLNTYDTLGGIGELTPLTRYSKTVSAQVPRMVTGVTPREHYSSDLVDRTKASQFPNYRHYITAEFDVSGIQLMNIVWTNNYSQTYPVTGVSGDNYIELDDYSIHGWGHPLGTKIDDIRGDTSYTPFRLDAVRFYPVIPIAPGAENLVDVLEWLRDNGPEYCNLGIVPLLPSDDFQYSTSITNLEAAISGNSYRNGRTYEFLTDMKFEDFLSQELRVAGCYLGVNVTGRILVKQIKNVASTDLADVSITSPVVSGGFIPYEPSPFGMYNQVTLYGGYSFKTQGWEDEPITIKDATAFGATRIARTLEIKPFSKGISVQPDDAVAIAQPILTMFGVPYVVASIRCNFKAFDAGLPGNYISFSSAQLPNSTGTRGVTNRLGLILGRKWDMNKGTGVLRVYVNLQRVAGYVPTFRISGTSGAGTSWTFTLTNTDSVTGLSWEPSAATDAEDWLAANYRFFVYTWDSTSTTRLPGTINTVSGNTVTVTMDSSFSPSGTQLLTFDLATHASIQSQQREYAYIAGTDYIIDFTAAEAARQFA